MSWLEDKIVARWRLSIPAGLTAADLSTFLSTHAATVRDAVASLERRLERVAGLRYALGSASQYGLVLHCDEYTLGAPPDPEKRENGEPALIDWRQTGGVIVAEGSDAAPRLLQVCGVVRSLGALGRALVKSKRPDSEWLGRFWDTASQAERLEDVPGAPGDGNLRLGLAMRAVEHARLGRSGTEVDKRSPRAGDVGHPTRADFRHADDIAHLMLASADRNHLGAPHNPSWNGRDDFKERRESRAARLEAAASRRSEEARERFEAVGRGLPGDGQPILVGHHSEARHRRALERSDMNMRKGVELQTQAAELSRRAAAVENNSAISSDDPEAIAKLEGRIAELEAEVVQWKDINKAVRSKTPEARLKALGFSEDVVMRLLKGDFLGRKGVPDYKFKNQNGNIRRLKARLAALKAAAATVAPEKVETAGGSMTWDTESNRIIIRMPAKSLTREEKTRRSSLMRSYGFVWAPTMGSYVRQASATGWNAGRAALKEITELP